jgi:hypothetical protein
MMRAPFLDHYVSIRHLLLPNSPLPTPLPPTLLPHSLFGQDVVEFVIKPDGVTDRNWEGDRPGVMVTYRSMAGESYRQATRGLGRACWWVVCSRTMRCSLHHVPAVCTALIGTCILW